ERNLPLLNALAGAPSAQPAPCLKQGRQPGNALTPLTRCRLAGRGRRGLAGGLGGRLGGTLFGSPAFAGRSAFKRGGLGRSRLLASACGRLDGFGRRLFQGL